MNTVNIYKTRTLLKSLELMKPTHTFLRDTFFPNIETFVTESVDVDFKKGKRKMAPFVAPRKGGIVMEREGFETKTYTMPKIAPERVLTRDDITSRGMGESIYSTRTPEERAKELLAKDVIELDDYLVRREEWMCREAMFNGKVIMKGEGFEQVVDFKFTNKVTLSGTDLWTDDASDPIQQMKEWRLSIIKKTGKAPDMVVMASDAADAFINNAKMKEYMDKRRLNLGNIEPSVKDDAITFIAKLPALGLEVYSYDEWFIDDDGVEQPMIPEGHVLMASKGTHKRFYGAVTQMEKGSFTTYEGTRIPKVWNDEDNEVKKIRLTSRPLPVPDDVDSWYVAVVK
ncbi:MAG: major capsid protein [Firmicutes bacterium]|nr:major capsid protein [Bacillota bacterium]